MCVHLSWLCILFSSLILYVLNLSLSLSICRWLVTRCPSELLTVGPQPCPQPFRSTSTSLMSTTTRPPSPQPITLRLYRYDNERWVNQPITSEWFNQFNISFTQQQENKPLGTSVLQLSVIDKDASHNGPPFNFRILSGNEGAWFKLDREGLLTSNQVFRRSEGTEYVIHVQVMRNAG